MIELHVMNRSGTLLKSYALGDHAEVIVGRDEACDIRIAAPSVSREHCAIEHQGQDLVVRDLGSSGGTLVDGSPVDSVTVRDGLQVCVGPAVLRFSDDGS